MDFLPPVPDYAKCQPLGVVPSLPAGGDFETSQVGPGQGIKVDGSPIQYVFWGRLLYREMNGTGHESGFALLVVPFGAGAGELDNDGYNYYN
jgi:hypothetical protein